MFNKGLEITAVPDQHNLPKRITAIKSSPFPSAGQTIAIEMDNNITDTGRDQQNPIIDCAWWQNIAIIAQSSHQVQYLQPKQ